MKAAVPRVPGNPRRVGGVSPPSAVGPMDSRRGPCGSDDERPGIGGLVCVVVKDSLQLARRMATTTEWRAGSSLSRDITNDTLHRH
jgi:hypothetical protein